MNHRLPHRHDDEPMGPTAAGFAEMETAMTLLRTPETTTTTMHSAIDTSLGQILLTSDGERLTGLYLDDFDQILDRLEVVSGVESNLDDDLEVFAVARQQLGEYLAGKRTRFDVPLAPKGTAFQLDVWHALTTIPYGATAGYGELAGWINRPQAARAVGAANGRNPISIIVPCHRVIGANGTMTGYAWGEDKKRVLLDLEAGR